MALGRKKSDGRKEPLFGLAASLSELRLGPQDRVPSGDDEPKKKPSAKRQASDSGDDAPRERKPRAKAASSKRKSRAAARSGLGRLVYWSAVLGLWAVIAAVGVVIWVGAHLP
ncbi:MAG: Multimodular transpeptidasetransglycosylase 34, partial [Bradyrhizobium sp.]|nr:Multimodular transpeptidasetransglycosylase 34 [Bradyrhizobium sp.]